jgi:bis(5'-nucleosyl)-tetraphosphatase (symmetrical)
MARPVFVGDVQGCADELADLLARVRSDLGDDFELWIVGDVVNRGPASLRALRMVRELVDAGRGRLVLGNHEIHLLRVAAGCAPASRFDTLADILEAPDAADWLAWLRRQPLAAIGLLGTTPVAMVHAALHPDWSLGDLAARAQRVQARLGASRADAEAFLAGASRNDGDFDALLRLVSCRSVLPSGDWSGEPPDVAGGAYRAWHAAWSDRRHAYGVVYGHWSMQGLHVAPGLRGLDTGCVHHGRGRDGFLTAWVPDPARESPFSVPDEAFLRVRARRAYYAHRDAAPPDGAARNSD